MMLQFKNYTLLYLFFVSRRRQRNVDEDLEENEGRSPLGPWPHGLSSVFAGLGCTLGIFNISRFAILSVHFGSNFILQFLMLSLLLGVPLLAFHAALGQTLGAGPVDMWKISPLFQVSSTGITVCTICGDGGVRPRFSGRNKKLLLLLNAIVYYIIICRFRVSA